LFGVHRMFAAHLDPSIQAVGFMIGNLTRAIHECQ
jgi:hypothetical protein